MAGLQAQVAVLTAETTWWREQHPGTVVPQMQPTPPVAPPMAPPALPTPAPRQFGLNEMDAAIAAHPLGMPYEWVMARLFRIGVFEGSNMTVDEAWFRRVLEEAAAEWGGEVDDGA